MLVGQSLEFVAGALYVLDYVSQMTRLRGTDMKAVDALDLIVALRCDPEFLDQRRVAQVDNEEGDDQW